MNPTQIFELSKDLNIFKKLEKKMKQASGPISAHGPVAQHQRDWLAQRAWPTTLLPGLMAQRHSAAWHCAAHTVLLRGCARRRHCAVARQRGQEAQGKGTWWRPHQRRGAAGRWRLPAARRSRSAIAAAASMSSGTGASTRLPAMTGAE
jgi:hypothetical protein